jgi:hypothetical protein
MVRTSSEARAAPLGEAIAVRVEEHADDRGSIRLWQVSPKIYVTRVTGHLSVEHARRIINYVEPLFQKNRVMGFHDWFGMLTYDSASRNELTDWSLRRRAQMQLNIGTRSALVNMGVTVAALALGDAVLRRFSDEASLQSAFDRALADSRNAVE